MPPAVTGPLASYRDLVAWRLALELCVECCRVARTFPVVERYALAAQLRRAAVSVPANIAEGYGRIHRAEYVHHLAIARGSLREVGTLLLVAARLEYLDARAAAQLDDRRAHASRVLTRLILSLRPDRRVARTVALRPPALGPPPL